jgi:RND family efflux transporter MFP subunit
MKRTKSITVFLRWVVHLRAMLSATLVTFFVNPPAQAQNEGFTEPYQTISLASSESGVISTVNVHVGDRVNAGQVVVELEKDLQEANLLIAEQAMSAHGPVELARTERELHKARLKKLEMLLAEGHARQEEVDRTRADMEIAAAKLQAAEEDLLMKGQEYERARLFLERRSVRAPRAGVISEILKDPGEFIAANDPVILNLVQLDPLFAVFNLTASDAAQLKLGQNVALSFPAENQTAKGTVEIISPLTDAESGTTRVKVRIANPEGRYRSGDRCLFDKFPSSAPTKPTFHSKSKQAIP